MCFSLALPWISIHYPWLPPTGASLSSCIPHLHYFHRANLSFSYLGCSDTFLWCPYPPVVWMWLLPSHTSSCVWTLAAQLVKLLWKVIKSPGSKASLEEVGPLGRELGVFQAIITTCFLSASCFAKRLGGQEARLYISATMSCLPPWLPTVMGYIPSVMSQTEPSCFLFPQW